MPQISALFGVNSSPAGVIDAPSNWRYVRIVRASPALQRACGPGAGASKGACGLRQCRTRHRKHVGGGRGMIAIFDSDTRGVGSDGRIGSREVICRPVERLWVRGGRLGLSSVHLGPRREVNNNKPVARGAALVDNARKADTSQTEALVCLIETDLFALAHRSDCAVGGFVVTRRNVVRIAGRFGTVVGALETILVGMVDSTGPRGGANWGSLSLWQQLSE
jgi:hypothetical protein